MSNVLQMSEVHGFREGRRLSLNGKDLSIEVSNSGIPHQ